ncbi:g6f-like isoform X2 [Antennarius striatus]|uniref:g6f-like isoform X2 n=1 Tax=Antennarius striatus TaxID=241820 RepID=UPI0035B131B3
MEAGFLTFILISSFSVYSSHTGITDWHDVVVAREDTSTTLVYTDATVRGAVSINWMAKTIGADEWQLVLSANNKKEFSGGASKSSMRLTDPNFQDTGVFSLFFVPKMQDGGLYSCLIKQEGRKLKERIILLAILTVTVEPAAPVWQYSTLQLIARVTPDFAVAMIAWESPGGMSMKSEKQPHRGTVAKLPQVQTSDSGSYTCRVHPSGNCSTPFFAFNVDVTVDANNVASFTNITHGTVISTATQAHTSFTLTCHGVQGDYVLLYWRHPDVRKQSNLSLVYQYDRWRGSSPTTKQSKRFQLAGPPYNAEAGSFAFLFTPGLKDSGLYICEVFLNDYAYSQRTLLSVLKVKTSLSPSKLELECLYKERSQVQRAHWNYQEKSRKLRQLSKGPGSIVTILPLPITSDTAGNYTCTLQLTNGQTVGATQAVTMQKESVGVTVHSLSPSLSALLLLVPLVAATVCVLLWKQKHISDRGIEQSLSVHSGEAENIYENPESVRQAPLEGSIYMDLKPRGEDDVYKELERCSRE